MTFHPMFGNHRKLWHNYGVLQFLDSLMLAFKTHGFDSSTRSINFFLLLLLIFFIYLFACLSFFLILCTNGYIMIRNYTRGIVNDFSKHTCN